MWVTSSLPTAITPTAIALGNFDGVHLGHQAVIRLALSLAGSPDQPIPPQGHRVIHQALPQTLALEGWSEHRSRYVQTVGEDMPRSAPKTAALAPLPTVMTFFPHPQEFFSGQSRPLLTPLTEKADQISRLGIGQLVLLPFNQDLANLSPEAFVETLLIRQLQAKRIAVGKDFRFGKHRQGTVEDLKILAQGHGVEVCIAPLTCLGTERISSSRIRAALESGDLDIAQALLGRPYSLIGRVVQGQQLGRTLGFPTANLSLPPDKFLPRYGVYSVWVQGATEKPGDSLPGVMNLGVRPTVNGLALTPEVHLLDWSGDLYGKTLQIQLHRYLRPELKFSSLEELKTQIQQDCRQAGAALTEAKLGN